LGETFGNTVAEAMMHGKPVITHLGDSSWPQAQCEVIGREDNIIRRQDVHAYVEYSNLMNDLMHNVEKYNEFQSYCMDRATNFFEYKAVAKKYSDLFEKVLSS